MEIQHLINPTKTSDIHTIRSFEKYYWRCKNPLHNYKIKTFTSKDKVITSFIIYYTEQNKIHLFDFAFNSFKEGKLLVTHTIHDEKKYLLIKGIVAFCQEKGTWSQQLKKIGFMSNPLSKGPLSYRTPFITFTDKKYLDKFNDSKKWNISPFDHDSI